MNYRYYVAVSHQGVAGLAATKKSVVQEEADENGDEVISVNSPNAFLARRQASARWDAKHQHH